MKILDRLNEIYLLRMKVHEFKIITQLCTMTHKRAVLLCSCMFLGHLLHLQGAFTPTFKSY